MTTSRTHESNPTSTSTSTSGDAVLRPGEGSVGRVLVTWGTKMGGTEGIAKIIGDTLRREGYDVTLMPASKVRDVSMYDAAVVGGALYANRWHSDARRFVDRNIEALRRIPVWMFSSGPLDDSAERQVIPPIPQVVVLMERVGALGHMTFGGYLAADAKGFPASAMAKEHSGDWRNPDQIRGWTTRIARALPAARPGAAIEPPGRSPARLLTYGVAGWALTAAVLVGLLQVASEGVAVTLHAIAAPLIFLGLALSYFRARGAREPLPTALIWTGIVAVLHAGVVAALLLGSFEMFTSFAATWLPFLLIFLVTWLTGFAKSTMPWKPAPSPTATGTPSTQT